MAGALLTRKKEQLSKMLSYSEVYMASVGIFSLLNAYENWPRHTLQPVILSLSQRKKLIIKGHRSSSFTHTHTLTHHAVFVILAFYIQVYTHRGIMCMHETVHTHTHFNLHPYLTEREQQGINTCGIHEGIGLMKGTHTHTHWLAVKMCQKFC